MIAVVTNENLRTQLLKLRRLQPETWLDHLVTSEEVGLEKPSPMPFQIALETMNLKASDCTFISDSIENDLETARELGFQCVWTTEFLETKSKSPFRTISKIEELDESI
jgi:putative hydrolase of the HAD superfamily